MSTKIYGASDDLIEVDGDVVGEHGCYPDNWRNPPLLFCNDGTVLSVEYDREGIWRFEVIKRGSLIESLSKCMDPNADPHSDVVVFRDGLKHVFFAMEGVEIQ